MPNPKDLQIDGLNVEKIDISKIKSSFLKHYNFLKNQLQLNLNNIGEDAEKQGVLIEQVSDLKVQLEKLENEQKLELEEYEYTLNIYRETLRIKVGKNPEAFGLKAKPVIAEINAVLVTDETIIESMNEVFKMKRLLIQIKELVSKADGLQKAFQAKKEGLRSSSDLIIFGYFGDAKRLHKTQIALQSQEPSLDARKLKNAES